MLQLGKVNKMVVNAKGREGYSLGHPETDEVAFLPQAIAPRELKIRDELKVFVYKDANSHRVLASPNLPKAEVGEFAWLRVVEAPEFGAFLDWGTDKDLLVPGNEQKIKLHVGDYALVRVCLEEGTDRVFGTTKFGKYLQSMDIELQEKDKVTIVPVEESDLGFRCILNRKYIGMIYQNEIFEHVEIGRPYRAFVKNVRPDGLIDVALQRQGVGNLFDSKDRILAIIKSRGGEIGLNDKSSPEDIYDMFGVSKKTFKAAVGMLYKERKILIKKDGIELVKSKDA